MVRERARMPRGRGRLRVVHATAATPILDLDDGVRLYGALQEQARQLDAILDDLRGRILRAMENVGVEEVDVDGVRAIRQIRHFAPRFDPETAARILEREGRLREAQRLELDVERAQEILDQLYVQGRVTRGELPLSEPRTVEALVIRENPDDDQNSGR